MGHERRVHGQDDGLGRPFDWLTVIRPYGIPEGLARVLHQKAVQHSARIGPGECKKAPQAHGSPHTSADRPGKRTLIRCLEPTTREDRT